MLGPKRVEIPLCTNHAVSLVWSNQLFSWLRDSVHMSTSFIDLRIKVKSKSYQRLSSFGSYSNSTFGLSFVGRFVLFWSVLYRRFHCIYSNRVVLLSGSFRAGNLRVWLGSVSLAPQGKRKSKWVTAEFRHYGHPSLRSPRSEDPSLFDGVLELRTHC